MPNLICPRLGRPIPASECHAAIPGLTTDELATCMRACAHGKALIASVRRDDILPMAAPRLEPVPAETPLAIEVYPAPIPEITLVVDAGALQSITDALAAPAPEIRLETEPKASATFRKRNREQSTTAILDRLLAQAMIDAFAAEPGPWVPVVFLGEYFAPEAFARTGLKFTVPGFHLVLDRRGIAKFDYQKWKGGKRATVVPVEAARKFVLATLGPDAWKQEEAA